MQHCLNRRRLGRWAILLSLVPMGALLAQPKATEVVATVDGQAITVQELQAKLSQLGPVGPGKPWEERKKKAADELVNVYLAGLKARSISLDNDTAFMRRTDYLLNQLATQKLFTQAVLSAITVTDSDAAERYRQKPENYRLSEWVQASHILIAPVKDTLLLTARQRATGWWAATDDKAKSIADSLYRMIQNGDSFDSLARQWSQDMATGIKGGDLGVFSRGQMVREFDSVAFNAPVDSVSPPIKTEFGYHIIKVIKHQNVAQAPLSDSLRQVIKQQLLNEKVIQRTYTFLDSLHAASGLTFNEKLLKMPDSLPPGEKLWAVASQFGDTVWSDRYASQLSSAREIAPGGKVDRDFKIGLLKDLINPLLVHRAAVDLKITESDEIQARKKQIFEGEKLNRVLQEANIDYNPADDEMRTYYELHKADFIRPESLAVHVQQMVFRTRKEAGRVLAELRAGGDFALLARKYFPGDSDIAQEAFDLGFVKPPSMPKNFFDVAETLSVGAVSEPVKTNWGYHLIRVLERQSDLSFESARARIVIAVRKAKQEEHRQQWEDALRAGHVISINDRVLRRIKYGFSKTGLSDRP